MSLVAACRENNLSLVKTLVKDSSNDVKYMCFVETCKDKNTELSSLLYLNTKPYMFLMIKAAFKYKHIEFLKLMLNSFNVPIVTCDFCVIYNCYELISHVYADYKNNTYILQRMYDMACIDNRPMVLYELLKLNKPFISLKVRNPIINEVLFSFNRANYTKHYYTFIKRRRILKKTVSKYICHDLVNIITNYYSLE